MSRLALLAVVVGLFSGTPLLLRRLAPVPPAWRIRLATVALVGLAATWSSLLAAILLPEVLTVRAVSELWTTCTAAFQTLIEDPLGRIPSLVSGAGLAVLLGRFTWSVALGIAATGRARVRESEGERVSSVGVHYPVYVVPVDAPAAYSIGGRHRQIVVSRGMLELLDEEERSALIRHEEAHLRGRHHGLLLVARAARRALTPIPAGTRLLALLEQALEESADDHAARSLRDPALVGRSVAKAALATLDYPVGSLGAVGGHDVPARVGRLMDPAEPPVWAPVACAMVLGLLLASVAVTQLIAGLALVAATHHLLGLGAAMSCPISPRT